MKFLVDNQLPTALARFLVSQGLDCRHVLDLRLDEASDITIWNYAIQEGMVLITKDEDFFHLANRAGQATPLIWVRLGNCRKRVLIAAFEAALPDLLEALKAGDRVVEIR